MVKRVLAGLLIGVVVLCSGYSLAQSKRVLVVHSYHQELDWTRQCTKGIEDVLANNYFIKYVYLDSKRVYGEALKRKVNEARTVFRQFKPDLVMLGDDNALRLLGPEMAATGIPVIYFGINGNPRKYFGTLPENVTGVIERIPLLQWSRILSDIVVGVKNALVLMDSSPTSKAVVARNFGTAGRVSDGRITVDYKMVSRWEEWQRIIHEPGAYDLIILPLYHALRDASGANVPFDTVIRWSSANTSVPLFAVQDYAVGDDGVVGAYVMFGEDHARMAAEIARSHMEGVPMSALLTPDAQQGQFYFNQKQLDRFGLTLPERICSQTVFK